MTLSAIWLIIGILLIVSELILPGFVVIFFGIGALISAALAYFTDITFITQGYVFIVASVLSLLVGRRCFKKTLNGKSELATGDADDAGLIGTVAIVTHAILPPQPGRVALQGSEWSAIAERPINVGATVKVIAQNNITLIVE